MKLDSKAEREKKKKQVFLHKNMQSKYHMYRKNHEISHVGFSLSHLLKSCLNCSHSYPASVAASLKVSSIAT